MGHGAPMSKWKKPKFDDLLAVTKGDRIIHSGIHLPEVIVRGE
jgi:hypothetical protein